MSKEKQVAESILALVGGNFECRALCNLTSSCAERCNPISKK